MDIFSIIKSRDVRDYIRRMGYQLPDRDAATILYNAGFSHKRLTRMLKELAEETEDEALRREIKERLAFEERCFFLFQQNDGNYFFQVRENAPAFTEPSGNFASLETALSYAKSHDMLFDIAKYEIVKDLSTAKKPVVHTNPRLKGDKPAEEIPYCGASVAEYTYNKDGSIIFRKYSPVGELNESAKNMAECISAVGGIGTAVCDRDRIIATAGIPKKDLLDKPVSKQLDELMRRKKAFISSGEDTVLAAEGGLRTANAAFPISCAGDLCGMFLLIKDEDAKPGETQEHLRLGKLASDFLSRETVE